MNDITLRQICSSVLRNKLSFTKGLQAGLLLAFCFQFAGQFRVYGQLVPIDCSSYLYQVTRNGTSPSEFWKYNPILGTREFVGNLETYVNAIGYNPTDGLIWASSGSGGMARISQIDANGTMIHHNITNLGTGVFLAGDVSPDGYYYLIFPGQLRLWTIDVNALRTGTYLKLVDPTAGFTLKTASPYYKELTFDGFTAADVKIDDWAYNPTDGCLYGVNRRSANALGEDNSHAFKLLKLNPLTGVITMSATAIDGADFQVTAASGANAYGACFFDMDGNFYTTSNNSGNFYRVNQTTLQATKISSATGIMVAQNDGAGCALAPPIPVDLGDAPDVYGTSLNSEGPVHILYSNLKIGNHVDSELDGLPTNDANGDDVDGDPNDEDGLSVIPALTTASTSYSITVNITNGTGLPATLAGWIDFNGDQVFSLAERTESAVPIGGGPVTLTWTGLSGIVANDFTYMRLRLASEAGEVASPTGAAASGEVEDYKIGITTDPMPVTLVSFNAVRQKYSENENGSSFVTLSWSTTSEVNSSHFEIEHSPDAKNWKVLGPVTANENSTTLSRYTFTDLFPVQSVNYYRLKMVDKDATYTYSRVVSVQSGESVSQVFVYPNPSSGLIQLSGVDFTGVKTIEVSDTNGKVIYKSTAPRAGTPVSHEWVNLQGYQSGMYILRVNYEDGSYSTHKFLMGK